jgi:Ser/Thr protein kinase RdoA (MazF antagonist)
LRDDSLLREAERDTGFVHGNLYLWNVLAHRSTLGIIDFENAGQGSVYLDLSLVSFQLALLSALPLTSSRTCHRLVRSFWEAYRTIRSFSPDVLHACAEVRAAQQRDWLARSESGTVLGIPLGRKHVRGLVDNALDHHARWCAFERPSHHSSESRWESA